MKKHDYGTKVNIQIFAPISNDHQIVQISTLSTTLYNLNLVNK